MLNRHTDAGFSLIETMVALALLLAGIAGASLLLLQCVQYERESSNRRAAIRLAGSLAESARARRDGEPLAPTPRQSSPGWRARGRPALARARG